MGIQNGNTTALDRNQCGLSRRKELMLVALLAVIVCLGWSWYAGKDLNWDQLNYHFYLPYSLLDGRLSKDFFPASVQSYLNPVSYLPFYWMVKAGWHSLAVGSILAIGHALNLVLLYLLCTRLVEDEKGGNFDFKVAAFFVGALSPVFWVEVGSSFNDITLCALTLGAIYIGLGKRATTETFPGLGRVALSGVLLGMVVGLKLTGAVFAVAGVMLFLTFQARKFVARLLVYVGAGILGYLLTGGYWAYLLFKEFGNPIFPFYNKVFASPLFVSDNLIMTRFIPGSFWDAVLLPFEMVEPVSWVYTETVSPDLRFAFVVAVLVVFGVQRLFFRARLDAPSVTVPSGSRADSNIQWRFIGFLVVSTALWLMTSSNGRYGIPIALLMGIVVVRLARSVLSRRNALLLVWILGLAQFGHLAFTAAARWSPDRWTSSWFELEVPAALVQKPHLFLSIGLQSNAFLAPFVHPASSFVNVIGQSSIDMNGAGGARLQDLMAQHTGNIRVLLGTNYVQVSDPKKRAAAVRRLSVPMARFGLQLNPDRCVSFKSRRELIPDHDIRPDAAEQIHYWIMSCEAFALEKSPLLEQERLQATRILDAIATTCPSLFSPKFPVVETAAFGFVRHYVGTEYYLTLNNSTKEVSASQVHASTDASFGKASDWENGPRKDFACPERHRSSPWFKAVQ